MARLLSCPYCFAEFTLEDWARKAACPECGRRVTFFEASGAAALPAEGAAGPLVAAPAGEPGVPPNAPPPGGASPAGVPAETLVGAPRTLFGKPLVWTRGWAVVLLVWAACAALLVVARVEMGQLTALTLEEQWALDEVPAATLPDGETTYAAAVDKVVERTASVDSEAGGPAEMGWWAFTRSWEDRVYVVFGMQWPDGQTILLGWWMENGEIVADPETERFLREVVDPDDYDIEPPGFPGFMDE